MGRSTNLADLVVDWDALRAINPDIVAWVYMPGTIINYPVAHKDGDSEYYLHHNFSLGEGSFGAEFGSIMLSGENAGDFSDEVNILYGHHMRNGSMFALFAEFRDSAIFNEHRTIYLLTPEGNYRLQTFAVEHVPMTHASIATPNYPDRRGVHGLQGLARGGVHRHARPRYHRYPRRRDEALRFLYVRWSRQHLALYHLRRCC